MQDFQKVLFLNYDNKFSGNLICTPYHFNTIKGCKKLKMQQKYLQIHKTSLPTI